ncbi:golgin subfamily A member 3 isoform X1 [Crotalus tigris]|uniref:golgin subfamily A member 3 isoform X1 n=1 Tax=Crotalus tigris TaxID=88082 RepID=UPI00192F1B02|nr:golgin subfamily A member 3 isoform X1 [Crotalus tigris]XP_039188321.1 golgin subfamily A member 3 isoform X1 [Crotalus tigris]XP_039188322.1 golgin subfamily A member 3 isoform X1 [Crotalus tigris]
MDSSVIIQEASDGTSSSSEQQPDLGAKSKWTKEDVNLVSVNNGRGSTEGDILALKSSPDPCANGPTSYDPEQPVTFGPIKSSREEEAASGVLGVHEHLEASQGGSDESLALRKDTLQSLKLSLPLQETKLCSADAPLPLEKEEEIRLQARKRLEEQLKQYRVKRHQERLFTAKSRLSSTLDPELMLHPELLPRASPVAMTKEYSFLRTSIPRGPKVGSLGLPASSKEKKSSKSSKTSRIRSLADYRTENPDGSTGGTIPVADSWGGSLKANSNSLTSVVSSVSLTPDSDDRLEASSLAGDSLSEMDGSEAGMRLDGNESDSSTYSSVSGRGPTSSSPKSQQGTIFTVNGQKIPLDAVGQFPSIREVLQAAATEYRAQEQEVNGEARSRRDSISSSISMESSVAGTHDELLQVLKEKMRLEGQLEALSLEANEALKEKAELQAQLAAVQMKLQTHMEHSQTSQQKQDSLNSEVATLKQSCWELERAMAELQTTLEAKNAGLMASHNDLQLAEEQYQRLMGKVEDLQKNVLSKDSTVHDLRQQLSSLQSQLQQVELDRASLTGKLKSSQAEISSLQKVRHWYQQQLAVAQQARIRLQSDMANVKAGHMTQVGLLEHLKLENVTLSHQLTETQHRSIKEKERIAAQLQNIEADMLDQEAAFLQIQEAKSMVEDDLQRKLEEFEEEKEQLQKMADSAAGLEQELEKVKLTLQQRDLQVESLQQEQLDLMKQLTSAQETLQTRDQTLGELQVRYDELEARLAELQGEAASKDDALRYLQNEKIVLEVALQVAKTGQQGLEEDIQQLGGHAEVASDVLEQLKQEIAIKSSQVENLQQESANLKKQSQKVKEQYLQQKVMVEAYRRDALSKDQLISELKATKKKLDAEIKELKQEFLQLQSEKKTMEVENSKLVKELVQIRQQMEELESQLQVAQKERNDMETELQSLRFDRGEMSALVKVNEDLQRQVDAMQQETKMAITEQKQKMKRLGSDLNTAQKEIKAKHKAYENAVGVLSRRLQEALAAKESSEAELNELKAQISESESNQASLERIRVLEAEVQSLSHSKMVLEKELQEVISLTSQELEEYREKVLELEDELQEARGFGRKIKRLEDANKKLSLELEHERGKLTGLGQSNAALREHNRILEAALAKREADLVQLNLQVQAVLRSKEEEDQKMKQLIQTLQMALEKERANVLSLKEQVTTSKAESAHNRRHYKAAALELGEVKRELQGKEVLIQALQAEVDKLQAEDGARSEEVSQIQRDLVDARSQLQLLQKQLDDQLGKQPAENQELEDLRWEVEQKEREFQALKQQLDLTEQRSQKELEGVQLVLQNLKMELEMVRDDLSLTQKDKFTLQAKMSELKNSIKTLLQQNQQLKLDLKQGKMKKKKLKGETSSNPVTPVKVPDCPVPAALLEELLKPPSAVSKEPLRNLNSCLQQLRQEMDSLQRQMEEHTVTVHESMSSWTQIEGQLTDLSTNLSVTVLANENLPHRGLQDQKPSTDIKEELTQ